jgi:predicted metal-dependent enzyme (double-stranded beta helix superfamily)
MTLAEVAANEPNRFRESILRGTDKEDFGVSSIEYSPGVVNKVYFTDGSVLPVEVK